MSTYGVSAPGIYDTQIIWAASDPNQSEEDSIRNGEKERHLLLRPDEVCRGRLRAFGVLPRYVRPRSHHQRRGLGLIDKNKAPDSTLYLKVGDEVRRIAQG